MKKKIVIVSCILLLGAMLVLTAFAYGDNDIDYRYFEGGIVSGDFKYIDNGGNADIMLYTGTGSAVLIPSALDNKPVTGIMANAFASAALTEIRVPASVTSFGNPAFGANAVVYIDVLSAPALAYVTANSVPYEFKGDISGDKALSVADSIKMSQYLADPTMAIAPSNLRAADVYYDGEVSIADVIKMKQYFADNTIVLD